MDELDDGPAKVYCKLCGRGIKVMAFRRDGFCSVLHKREYEAQHSEE